MGFNFSIFIIIIMLFIIVNFNKQIPRKKRDSLFLKITFFIFFLVVAFRGFNIGNDTQMYLNLFQNCVVKKWQIIVFGGYFEIGYLFINVIIGMISSSSRFFMLVMSAILNYGMYKFIKENSDNYFLSSILYVGMLFLYTSMTMMRQFTALIIVLYSIKYAKEKKLFKFVFIIFIASLFHTSAWICLIYYLIVNIKFTRKRVFVIILVSFLAMLMIGPLTDLFYTLVSRTNYYENRLGSEGIANIIYTFIYLSFFVFTYTITKNKNEKLNNFYLYSMLFAVSANMLGINMDILSRVSLYFNALTIIALPNLINNKFSNKNANGNIKIYYFLIILFFVVYSSSIIFLKPEWNSAYNYELCLTSQYGCNDLNRR